MNSNFLQSPSCLLGNISAMYPTTVLPCSIQEEPDEPAAVPEQVDLLPPDNIAFADWLTGLLPVMFTEAPERHPDGYALGILVIPIQNFRNALAAGSPKPECAEVITHILTQTDGWCNRGADLVQIRIPQCERTFGVEMEIWGQDKGISHSPELRKRARKLTHDHCDICGFHSQHNRMIFRDGNPENTENSNLGIACPICLLGQHLNKLDANAGVMVYLPGLRPSDLNHLLRTVFVARTSDNEDVQADARKIINWLISHRKECEKFWGTSHPGEFGEALLRAKPDTREDIQHRLRNIALIPNPALLTGHPAFGASEVEMWAEKYLQWKEKQP
ncbi:hypothetical protein WAB73_003258 [Salmonella enterica subsp. enterica]